MPMELADIIARAQAAIRQSQQLSLELRFDHDLALSDQQPSRVSPGTALQRGGQDAVWTAPPAAYDDDEPMLQAAPSTAPEAASPTAPPTQTAPWNSRFSAAAVAARTMARYELMHEGMTGSASASTSGRERRLAASAEEEESAPPRSLEHLKRQYAQATNSGSAAAEGHRRPDRQGRGDLDHDMCEQQPVAPPSPPPPLLPQQQAPLAAVAERLAALQAQQSATLAQLLSLRLEQIRLRSQQLSALQGLLRSELLDLDAAASHLQLAAVNQASGLLAESIEDMHTSQLILRCSTGVEQLASAAEAVSAADARAEEVSCMARQLLTVLRGFPRRAAAGAVSSALDWATGRGAAAGATAGGVGVSQGAPDDVVRSLPQHVVQDGSPLLGEPCSICLSEFEAGDTVKSVDTCATHYHHAGCLNEWLRIRATCPLCKAGLAAAAAQVVPLPPPTTASGGSDVSLLAAHAATAAGASPRIDGADGVALAANDDDDALDAPS